MATHHGKDGLVKIGSDTVAEVTEFSVESSVDVADDTVMGDPWKTHLPGQKEWSGSLSCFWDESDTNGQEAMTEGASVALKLCPEGYDTGDKYLSGTATITRVTVAASKDGVVTRAFQFQGNGALAWATAS